MQQLALHRRVDVAGQQHPPVAVPDAQHHRPAVAVGVCGQVAWGCEHLDEARAQREAHAGAQPDHRHAARPRDRDGLGRAVGQGVRRTTRPVGHQQRGDVVAP
ncbi:MAG TPA: hypothetical protein VK875_00440 [Euzebyales bacterium]|nr:hypothetical protein [Euzebyales bacterium]